MKTKRFAVVAVFLVLCLCLCACASRPQITPERFTTACTEAGLTVIDVTDQTSGVAEVALTVEDTTVGTISYVRLLSTADAKGNYAQLQDTFSALEKDGSVSRVDSAEYNKYIVKNGSQRIYLYRNGTTIVLVYSQNAETAEKVAAGLGL